MTQKTWSDKYKTRSEEEKAAFEKNIARAKEYREKLKAIGAACLADPKFSHYRQQYEALERLTFDQVRQYKNPDPIQYAMVVSNMLTELNTFEALINDISLDANRKEI